jgi:hypothetical protein
VSDDLDKTTIEPGGAIDVAAAPAETPPAPNILGSQVPTAQVVPSGGRQRWMIAAGVVAVLVVVSAVAFSLFTGRAANAIALGYVPSDSIMYGEFRMDLPGDQRAAVGSFLSKFPGFADQSTIETKIDEVLDRIVGGATDGEQAFSADIKPWFGGELAFSVGALPDPATLESPDAAMDDARFLALVSVKDEAAALAWFDAAIADAASGSERTNETYNNATIHHFVGQNEPPGAFAVIDGKIAVIGDPASVRAAVDTKGAGGLAANPTFKAAIDAKTGDHLGFMYVALRPLLEWSAGLTGEMVPGGAGSDVLTGFIPEWAAFALRIEGDAVRMESLSPKPEGEAGVARTSSVADHVPSSAIALSISNDYGKGVLSTIDTFRDEPSLKEVIDGLDQAIGLLGGTDAAIGWIGDLGIAVTRTDGGMEGGLVITPTDRTAAESLFTSLRTLASLGGSTAGISVRDEAHAGTTITIIDLGSLEDLAGLAGAAAGAPPDVFGSALPSGRIELAYAITDQVVVIGSGPGFVRSVLDTTAASSLGQTERYKSLVSRAGGGSASAFVDITAVREIIEGAMVNADASELAAYETEIKPFLVPIDALVAAMSTQGDINRQTVIVTVK